MPLLPDMHKYMETSVFNQRILPQLQTKTGH